MHHMRDADAHTRDADTHHAGVQVTPLTRERLAEEIAQAAAARPGRLRVAVDGAPPTAPEELAAQVARRLPDRKSVV